MAETIALALLTAAGVTGATAVAVTTFVVGAVLSVGASLLAQYLMPKPEASPSDRQNTVKLSIAPRARHYGRVRIGGAVAFEQARAGKLYRVTAHGDGLIDGIDEHVIQDEPVTLDGAGAVVTPAKWAGLITVKTNDGREDPAHYTALEAAFPEWDETHLGQGVQSSLVTMTQVDQETYLDVYPNGIKTTYKQTVRGARLWDPREPGQNKDDPATWAWSDNAALVALDHLRHQTGFGMPDAWVLPQIDDWKRAADVADQAVTLKQGGSEPRYRASGTYSYDERPADVLQRILAAANARVWIGDQGGLTYSPGVWTPPTVTIDGMAIESYQIGAGNEGPDVVNEVVGVFTDPESGYVEAQSPAWSDPVSIEKFGVKRSPPAKLYMVPSNGQCRRLMKQAYAGLSPEWRGRLVTNLRGLPALSERFVRIVIEELGLDFTAEIQDVQFVIESGTVVRGLAIDFISMDAATFDWDAATEEGDRLAPPPPIGATAIPAPTGFAASGSSGEIIATWAAGYPITYRVAVEYRETGTLPWFAGATGLAGATSVTTSGLTAGTTYDVRARGTSGGRSSAYTAVVTATA